MKQLDNLDLTAVEKIRFGNAYGVPQWLKDGYTTLVGDVDAASLEELRTLGSEAALRIVWAQNQTHLLPKKGPLYCGVCVEDGNGNYEIIYYETGQLAGSYRCPYCNNSPESSGQGVYSKHAFSGSKPLINSSVAEKVAEVFKDEIEEAERRNTPSPD